MPRTLNLSGYNRELRPYLKEMVRSDWTWRENGHLVCTSPDGVVVTISKTPRSDATLKVAADFRRAGLVLKAKR